MKMHHQTYLRNKEITDSGLLHDSSKNTSTLPLLGQTPNENQETQFKEGNYQFHPIVATIRNFKYKSKAETNLLPEKFT